MSMTRGAVVVALLTLLATACGSSAPTPSPGVPSASRSSSTSLTTPTPTESPTGGARPELPVSSNATFNLLPVPQPTHFVSQITCSGSIGVSDPVAIVQLHAAVAYTGKYVLRDYANPLNPRTACQLPGPSTMLAVGLQLIDARHLVIPFDLATYAVVDLPEVRYHWFRLPVAPSTLPMFIAVGPHLDQVLWLRPDQANGGTDQVHVTTSGGDRVVASLPNPHEGRCGSPDDSALGAYTHSGARLFVLDQPIPNLNSLMVVEGETPVLSLLPPTATAGWPRGGQPEMAVWSPTSETLYYRQAGDVWRWTPGAGPRRFLRGVNWLNPTIAPDGRHLAYAVLRPDGVLHDVYLIDLAQGASPRLIRKGPRTLPVFLTSTDLWFKTENAGICGPGGNQPLIYDITDGSELPSIIDDVIAAWPATSSNY